MGNNPIIAIDPNGGNCVDINGNPTACPEDEFYDDYRDNEENQITVLEEVSASNSSGSWSSEGLKDVPATWESPFVNMDEFNNYYGTNFGQSDYDAAMRWLQKQQRDVMVAQHMAEFYRGRSEMSQGVLKLMFTIVTSVQFAELGTLGYIATSEYLAAKSSGLVARGLGSTGRTTAANLTEQLAMKEIVSNPRIGTVVMEGMKDSRWLGWSKMQYVHRGLNGSKTTIHYVGKFENGVLKYVDDFKFK
ncbi:hypothetical protein NBRC110019_30490 [Neptunitalea chrysea]|uniref:Uncharacterized protein n=2 Tax=Neptunitalea chrysea TaxID=1647581 RepID=A0A9W6EWZ1_9FLAO|nr:hypothetical protein NBRC110019_30490 [Neptunitalea chrysea]